MSRSVTNSNGYRELFTSGEMYELCREAAEKVAQTANEKAWESSKRLKKSGFPPYRAHASVHSNTCVGSVVCIPNFYELEMKHGCLKKSIK